MIEHENFDATKKEEINNKRERRMSWKEMNGE
jgi:hypothetical protein